jgi:tetrahydromethanopterin S-methyltransferase subunit F
MIQSRSMAERENDRLVEQVRYREPLDGRDQAQQHLRDTRF